MLLLLNTTKSTVRVKKKCQKRSVPFPLHGASVFRERCENGVKRYIPFRAAFRSVLELLLTHQFDTRCNRFFGSRSLARCGSGCSQDESEKSPERDAQPTE